MKLSAEMSFMMSFQISYYCDKMSEPIIRLLEMHRTGEMENRSLTRDEFLSLLGDCNLPFRWKSEHNASNYIVTYSASEAFLLTQSHNNLISFQGPENDPEVRHLGGEVASPADHATTLLKMLHLRDGDSQDNLLQ